MEGRSFNDPGMQLPKTNSGTKQFEDQGNKKKHMKEGASFIVVLGPDFAKQLKIPHEFTSNFNGCVPHRVIIEGIMTKKCWRVEVEKDGDGILYFRDGWGDFVAAHFLEVGNFLVFRYEEQSIFQVKFYGKNGCEKTTVKDAELNGCKELRKTTLIDEDGENEAFNHEQKVFKKHCREKTRRLSLRNYERRTHKMQHVSDMNDRRVHSKTRATEVLISENSVCFSITMHKRKKHQFYQVTIPMEVSLRKQLSSKEKMILQDAKGKCWPIKITHRRDDGRAIFCRGWKDFLHGNEVAPGDRLNFEFISDDLIQVHVTRASKVVNHRPEVRHQTEASGSPNINCEHDEQVTCASYDKAVDHASVTAKKAASFSFAWSSNTARGFLYIPKAVAMAQNLRNKESVVLRDPEGKCWPLEVSNRSDGCTALTKGWPEFWEGLGVTAGDSLTFNFVSEFLIQVTINRGKPLENVADGAAINSVAIPNEGLNTHLEALVTRH